MQDDWGPWIFHDGSAAPKADVKIGDWVSIKAVRYGYLEGCVNHLDQWGWVICYRVRKPKGLQMLRELVENLPQPTPLESGGEGVA